MVYSSRETPQLGLQTITNTELTFDQLTAIAGGVQMATDGSTCTDRLIWKDIKDIFGGGKDIIRPKFRSGGSAIQPENI